MRNDKQKQDEKFLNILTLAVSVFICIFAFELFLRVFYDVGLGEDHETLVQDNFFGELFDGYPMKANYSFVFSGNTMKISPSVIMTNSEGLRDNEYNLSKAKNVYRIISAGDSVAFGQGVYLNQTFPKILEGRLNRVSAEKKYEVINFGVPGLNTYEELELIEKIGLEFNPDLIILTVVSNDHEVRDDIIRDNQQLDNLRREFLSDADFQIQKWLEAKILLYEYYHYNKNINKTLKDESFLLPLKLLINLAKENSIELVVVSYMGAISVYPGALELLSEQNITYLELVDAFEGMPPEKLFLGVSGGKVIDGHLNYNGNRIVADLIFEHLVNLSVAN